jgi:hypothetical protein
MLFTVEYILEKTRGIQEGSQTYIITFKTSTASESFIYE